MQVQFSRILFDSREPAASTRRFYEFARRCTPARLMWLSRVVIEEKPSKKDKDMMEWLKLNRKHVMELLRFCAAHRHVTVEFRVPHWTLQDRRCADSEAAFRFLYGGIAFELMFRQIDRSDIAPDLGDNTRPALDLLIYETLDYGNRHIALLELSMQAPNIRFYPQVLAWDAAKFGQDALEGWNAIAMNPLALPPDGVDVWIDCVQGWMSKGI